MMYETVSNACFVDVTRLRIADFEMRIRAVSVCSRNKVRVKRGDIFYEIIFKCLHVFPFLFTAQELLPSVEQIIGENDIVVRMRDVDSIHSSERTPRPVSQEKLVPVVLKLKEAYLAWQMALPHVAKARRQTIAVRIDGALLDTLEYAFRAGYLPGERKIAALETAIAKLDIAKFFLLVGWESDAITNAQHFCITGLLVDASKMLVGWRSYLEKKTPANGSERK